MAIIAHLDLDAFFASCERARTPELADQAIVICMFSGRGEDGGAVSTAGYTARDHGIHAGMPIVQAKENAADTEQAFAFLQADKEYYKAVSGRIMDILAEDVQRIEAASVDEAYADLSDHGSYAAAVDTMNTVKDRIQDQEAVTASVGIAPNKLIAKMASDRDKPDGMTVIKPDQVDAFLTGMPVDELHGVGDKTAAALRDMGAETVDGLRDIPVQQLIDRFGEARGVQLRDKARGDGATNLAEQEKKQLSRLRTLEQDIRNMATIRPAIRDLADQVIDRLDRREQRYTTVAALIVTEDVRMRTRSTTLKVPTTAVEPVFRNAEEMTAEFLENNPATKIRRIGVRVAGLEDDRQRDLTEF
jgi:DNA polymerase IV (DinB-like DNA polymerase)